MAALKAILETIDDKELTQDQKVDRVDYLATGALLDERERVATRVKAHRAAHRVVKVGAYATPSLRQREAVYQWDSTSCPVCGSTDLSLWADDGESPEADYWECPNKHSGVVVDGALRERAS